MKTRHFTLTLVCAAVLAALAVTPAMAQSTTTSDTRTSSTTTNQESTRLSGEFSTFAGSDMNSQALVNGLHAGSAITLQNADGTSSGTTIQPLTGKMGYGNVKIALSMAEASLAKAGITDPTAAQIAVALNGGTLTLADGNMVDLQGVMAARAAGKGWGQMANGMGFKLGDLMRSPQAADAGAQAEAKGHVDANGHAQSSVDAMAHAGAGGDFGKSQITNHPTGMSGLDHPQVPAHSTGMSGLDHPQVPAHPTGMSGLDHPQVPAHPTGMSGFDHPQVPAHPTGMSGFDHPQVPEHPQMPNHAGGPRG
jgi:hypothetical protein